MKKKTVAVVLSILGIVLLTGFGAFAFLKGQGHILTGRVFMSEGTCIFISDATGEPVVIHNQTKNQDLFAGFLTGDRVLVVGDGTMMLSYPAQMNVYFALRLGGGDPSDIPEETRKQLQDMGW